MVKKKLTCFTKERNDGTPYTTCLEGQKGTKKKVKKIKPKIIEKKTKDQKAKADALSLTRKRLEIEKMTGRTREELKVANPLSIIAKLPTELKSKILLPLKRRKKLENSYIVDLIDDRIKILKPKIQLGNTNANKIGNEKANMLLKNINIKLPRGFTYSDFPIGNMLSRKLGEAKALKIIEDFEEANKKSEELNKIGRAKFQAEVQAEKKKEMDKDREKIKNNLKDEIGKTFFAKGDINYSGRYDEVPRGEVHKAPLSYTILSVSDKGVKVKIGKGSKDIKQAPKDLGKTKTIALRTFHSQVQHFGDYSRSRK